jgi:hypothetical protein
MVIDEVGGEEEQGEEGEGDHGIAWGGVKRRKIKMPIRRQSFQLMLSHNRCHVFPMQGVASSTHQSKAIPGVAIKPRRWGRNQHKALTV